MYHDDIIKLRAEASGKDTAAILCWVAERFTGKAVFTSALGAEDQVITDLICRLNLNISIVTLDTGRLFATTYQLMRETEKHYDLRFRVYFPDRDAVENMVNEHGTSLFLDSVEKRKLCCGIRKIEPLRRALSGFQTWICGLRREQSVTRSDIHVVDWDEGNQMVKVNPLTDWSENEIWEYIARYEVPYNRLHDQGYPSIGCAGCTRAVKHNEDIRAGRWCWELSEQKECGLHVVDGKLVKIKK